MLRTAAFATYFFPMMGATGLLFVPLGLVRLFGGIEAAQRFVQILTGGWARHVFSVMGVRVRVNGRQRLPSEKVLCVVSNHQGAADIPLVVGFVPRNLGFIAKKELSHIPVLSNWMRAIHSVFLERSSPRHARFAMQKAAALMQKGRAMILFPEGTRSRGPEMGRFKTGAMQLPKDAGAAVLPLTIDGTYRVYEEKNDIRPGTVTMTIHPLVPKDTVQKLSRKDLAHLLEEQIAKGLDPASDT